MISTSVYVNGGRAESLSAFFKAIHLDTHVGSLPTALRQLKHRVEAASVEYSSGQAERCQPTEGQGAWLETNETFFELPTPVIIELASGFIFTEVETKERTYTTWKAKLPPRWELTRWTCHVLVSDEAQALIKLTTTGLSICKHLDV